MRSARWLAVALIAGSALSIGACLANAVPSLLGEVGTPRAERSGWAQLAEFASLILDSGWAWAAMAVTVGWVVRAPSRSAAAACVSLSAVPTVHYWVERSAARFSSSG
ncbi:hypothetical protein [Cryptosporangium phraense]|uniref:Uncharacterized protein n=1 Tax=Cryptosporangium phraense TaxID=2593070 RepID=A0A545AJ83_9ACTN|nr:hypothetical protein [Cryptosporangium phraense]TQS41382.1 hypothetical protein FL583_30235 [Cryptosporangium phraense]